MTRLRPSVLLSFAGVSTLLIAGGVSTPWQDKPFEAWTEKDAQLIMSDSPWAKKMAMPAAGRPEMTVIEPGANGGSAAFRFSWQSV